MIPTTASGSWLALEDYFRETGAVIGIKRKKNPFVKSVEGLEKTFHIKAEVDIEEKLRARLQNGLLDKSKKRIRELLKKRKR